MSCSLLGLRHSAGEGWCLSSSKVAPARLTDHVSFWPRILIRFELADQGKAPRETFCVSECLILLRIFDFFLEEVEDVATAKERLAVHNTNRPVPVY